MNVTVDSESASSPTYTLTDFITWINTSGAVVSWTNNSSAVVGWSGSRGYVLYKNDAQQYGKYLGMTVQSNSAAFVINGFEFEHELRVRF
jgi:hypothetical protein